MEEQNRDIFYSFRCPRLRQGNKKCLKTIVPENNTTSLVDSAEKTKKIRSRVIRENNNKTFLALTDSDLLPQGRMSYCSSPPRSRGTFSGRFV